MSRPLRIQYPNAWYHVLNRGRRGESIFLEDRDYNAFIDLLKDAAEMWRIRIGAYCLMPNHYHILVQTPEANLSRCMRHINGVYTQRFNRFHSCEGQLFRGRYKCILVDADSYILELVRYIHRNPLEAGLVDRLDRYPWSSHKGYLSDGKKWQWLYKAFVFSLFSNDGYSSKQAYRKFISKDNPEEINRILGRRKWPPILGSEVFIDSIKNKFYNKERYGEIPESKSLAPTIERIKDKVSAAYGVKIKELFHSRRGQPNEPRNVAIYLSRRVRGDALEEIGKKFGIKKYSTVASVIARLDERLSKELKLRRRIKNLEKELEMSQGQT